MGVCNDPGNQVPDDPSPELGSEVDRVALVVFRGRNVQCGQHRHDGTPHRGVGSVPA